MPSKTSQPARKRKPADGKLAATRTAARPAVKQSAAPAAGRAAKQAGKRSGKWLSTGIELEQYAPAYFTFITTKLAGGAASVYRRHFGVGIEVWRVLVMLALDEKVSVNMVCRLIGMDKGSVSRAFKSMYEMGLITFSHDPHDGRVRYATLTEAGRRKHDEIKAVAMERQRAFLSCLAPGEVPVLMEMLWRLHANLPKVEQATQAYLQEHVLKKPAPRKKKEEDDE